MTTTGAPTDGDAATAHTDVVPWARVVVDARTTGQGTPLPDPLPPPSWQQPGPDGAFTLAAYLFDAQYTRRQAQDCVLLVSDATDATGASGALVVHRGGAVHVPGQRIATIAYGIKPILDHRNRAEDDLSDYDRDRIARAWSTVPALHAALTDPDLLDGLSAATGDLLLAVEYASHGATSPQVAKAVAGTGLRGSWLHYWRNRDWTMDQIAVLAPLVERAPSPDWHLSSWSLPEIAQWVNAGIHRPEMIEVWRAAGVDDETTMAWAFTAAPEYLVDWRATGMPPDVARRWHAWGRLRPSRCRRARSQALSIADADALLHAIGDVPDQMDRFDAVLDLLSTGVDLRTVHLLAQAGVSTTEARGLVLSGRADPESLRTLAALRGRWVTWEEEVQQARARLG